ncbi:14267_t:CDS:2 [Entrophospora sp. SA101]|nr:192_t:CDS:2 [Entrophospora sp. SA101]CAJ0754253.1 14267_t:CDS:2 [Entrophospora sp. SA101]
MLQGAELVDSNDKVIGCVTCNNYDSYTNEISNLQRHSCDKSKITPFLRKEIPANDSNRQEIDFVAMNNKRKWLFGWMGKSLGAGKSFIIKLCARILVLPNTDHDLPIRVKATFAVHRKETT